VQNVTILQVFLCLPAAVMPRHRADFKDVNMAARKLISQSHSIGFHNMYYTLALFPKTFSRGQEVSYLFSGCMHM
jgi:hypothetical protein